VCWQFDFLQVHSARWVHHIPCGFTRSVGHRRKFHVDVSIGRSWKPTEERADAAQRIAIQWCRAVGLEVIIYNPKLDPGT
jgi:hypothetical protein